MSRYIDSLKRLHKAGRITDWQYEELTAKDKATEKDYQNALGELGVTFNEEENA